MLLHCSTQPVHFLFKVIINSADIYNLLCHPIYIAFTTMSARYVSSQLFRSVTKNGRTLTVDIVDRTTAWVRPSGWPPTHIREDFARVVEDNISVFNTNTVKVAMKSVSYIVTMYHPSQYHHSYSRRRTNRESEHQSNKDQRVHYTVYGIDKDGQVIETKHIVRSVK